MTCKYFLFVSSTRKPFIHQLQLLIWSRAKGDRLLLGICVMCLRYVSDFKVNCCRGYMSFDVAKKCILIKLNEMNEIPCFFGRIPIHDIWSRSSHYHLSGFRVDANTYYWREHLDQTLRNRSLSSGNYPQTLNLSKYQLYSHTKVLKFCTWY